MKLAPRYRMLCDGEQEWTGRAQNPEHAEQKCFRDEEPGSLCRYTLERWQPAPGAPQRGKWVTIYKDASLTPA